MNSKNSLTNGINSKSIIARPPEFAPPTLKSPKLKEESTHESQPEINFDADIVKVEMEEVEEMVVSTSPRPVEDYRTNASSNFYSSPSSPESEESSQSSSQGVSSLKPGNKALASGSAIYQVQNGSSIPQQQYIFLDEKQVEMLQQGVLPTFLQMATRPSSATKAPPAILHKANERRFSLPETSEASSEIREPSEDEYSQIHNSTEPPEEESSDDETERNLDSMDTGDEDDCSRTASQEMIDIDCPLPNLLSETGKYGFKIILDDKEDTLKTPTWLMSKITKKLYTNMNKAIPFRVVLKKRYPKKAFFLRAMAVFKYPMFLRQNVIRCPNHLNPNDATNVEFPYTNHVIRADHPRAIYESSPSGRLSVLVPLGFPENRNEAVPVLLKFMCHNSCVGGISRRPLAVLLSLEIGGEEVGRYTVDVRVCACPSRDVKTEENHMMVKGLHKKMGDYYYEERRGRKRPKKEVFEDENLFFLQVRGHKLYKYLQETKALYLKTHPEYSAQYPDFHADSIRAELESPQDDSDMTERGGSCIAASPPSPPPMQTPPPPIQTPPSTSKFTTTTSSQPQESPRPLIYIIAKSGERLNPSLLNANDIQDSTSVPFAGLGGTKPPLLYIKQESSAVFDSNPQRVMKVELPSQKPPATKPDANNSIKSKSAIQLKDTMPLVRANSSSSSFSSIPHAPHSFAMIKTNSFSGTTKMLTSEMISARPRLQRPHLQVQSMPDKSKKAVQPVVPKQMNPNSTKRSTGGSFLKRALQKEPTNVGSISSDENEKVMLAAEVLASNMGSRRVGSK